MKETQDKDDETARLLTAGRKLFARDCRFMLSVASLQQLPGPTLPEVAFAGRSNVGKSSLLNALTGRRDLARTSNTPGRTQQINYFDLDGRLRLVDLPGYGYARAPKEHVRAWTRLVNDFLRGRPNLARVFLLIDSRHGIKAVDEEIMSMLDTAAVVYQITLTKADKVKAPALETVRGKTAAAIAKRPAAHPDILVTSSAKNLGFDAVRAEIAALAENWVV